MLEPIYEMIVLAIPAKIVHPGIADGTLKSDILKKLESIAVRFNEVGQQIVDPDIIADMDRYVKLNKEYKELEEIVQVYKSFKNVVDNIETSKQMLETEEDPEMKEMAKMELDELLPKREEMEEEIKVMLIPKDPEDDKNVIATCDYGGNITAAAGRDNIIGTQFHPEKSGTYGQQILKNFLNL